VTVCDSQQISIARIEQMPNRPSPYVMRNWKRVVLGYDSLVFNPNTAGQYLPLVSVNQNFSLSSYVGQSPSQTKEAINCLPAVVSASLVGVDKTNQFGFDWVSKCANWYNQNPRESVYLNNPGGSSGSDWWYDMMPNVFFYQLYSLYPNVGNFRVQSTLVADRWLAALSAMGAATTPWSIANIDHRAWYLATMTPNNTGVHEREAAGTIAWILYSAFAQTGNPQYRIGAELAMESLMVYPPSANPSYELQLPYGAYIAARMNAELGAAFDIGKLMEWCFSDGGDNSRRWGVTTGNWGGYDCAGLIGETSETTGNGYPFAMNTFEQVGALVPLVRYDARYARIIGKWVLNAANASRLFYTNYLPDQNQDGAAWSHQYDPGSYIAHESMHEYKPSGTAISPYATGDAIRNGNPTNFALYGSSHAGIMGGIIDTTNVPMILRLDVLKTDYYHATAYPSFLFFNPDSILHQVNFDAGPGQHDVYDAVAHSFIAQNVSGVVLLPVGANSAVLAVVTQAHGTLTYDLDKMLINGVVVDFHSGHITANYPPRIKSLTPDTNIVLRKQSISVYCTAVDKDNDTLTYAWSATGGSMLGSGTVVVWNAPDTAGTYLVQCTVGDTHGAWTTATDTIVVAQLINHPPVIQRMTASPRKVPLGKASAINCIASDADGNALTYRWSAANGIVIGAGSVVSWQAAQTAGNYYIRCTVDDGRGGTTADSIAVEVRDVSTYVKGSLLASYPFNGTANDVSGNGRNGVVNNAALTADRNGHPNCAYSFDGSTSSIRIPNDNGLNVQKAFAVNVWMKIGAFYSREQYPLSHGNYMNRWKISISNKHLRWTVKTTTGIKDLDSETELAVDSLYNVSVQYDGADMEVYLNGGLDAFVPWSGAIAQTTVDVTIGQAIPGDNNYNFNGVLDDIRFFDYGLSLGEVAAYASDATAVKNTAPATVPRSVELQAYPNPFNPGTTIRCALPARGHVTVTIFNVLGQEISRLADEFLPAGTFELRWNADRYPSGMYYCVMTSPTQTLTHKLLLMR
jgi:Concanavalin A-like lectin/glucanases superfamily